MVILHGFFIFSKLKQLDDLIYLKDTLAFRREKVQRHDLQFEFIFDFRRNIFENISPCLDIGPLGAWYKSIILLFILWHSL